MSDFHQMLRDRQYYLVGPPPAEEEVLAAQQALGLGEAYDLEDLQSTPESLPVLGSDVPGQEDFAAKNTVEGVLDRMGEGVMEGVEFANKSFIDEFDAVFQRYKPGTLQTLRESGGMQPLNVTPTDNPTCLSTMIAANKFIWIAVTRLKCAANGPKSLCARALI